MNGISDSARLYAQASGARFKKLGSRGNASPRIPKILEGIEDEFVQTLALALTQGCGLLLSPTSDGGAVSVILYDGDDRFRSYASTSEEFNDAWNAIRDHVEAKMVGSTPTAKKSAVRGS